MRQLENICHWLTVMAPAQMIEAKDLPPELQAVPAAAVAAAPVLAEVATLPAHAPMPVGLADPLPQTAPVPSGAAPVTHWLSGLEQDARSLLLAGQPEVWDTLTRKFEAQLIHTALEITRGRRIEAAQKLGIGRNTITRKIQELGLDD